MTHGKTKITTWHGCYDGDMKALISPASFRHPAKMSRKLTERIFDHGAKQGYWNPGDSIVDPFGGIGTTGFIGAYRGYRVTCIELEGEFVDLFNGFDCDGEGRAGNPCGDDDDHNPHHVRGNLEINRRKLERLGNPLPQMIHGDSRVVLKRLAQPTAGAISSPPFLQSSGGAKVSKGMSAALLARHAAGNRGSEAYGESTGQIHNLPEGDPGEIIGGITSPPYASGHQHTGGNDPNPEHIKGGAYHGVGIVGAVSSPPYAGARIGKTSGESQVGHEENYGSEPGQLGNMPEGTVQGAISSPPYADIRQHGGNKGLIKYGTGLTRGAPFFGEYGTTEGQLGAMPEGDPQGAITSPPYEDSLEKANGIDPSKIKTAAGPNSQALSTTSYGDTDGQIGATKGDTYWGAVADIYRGIYNLLPPGGAFAVVVKDFVRNKKRVPLCDNTADLLQAIGFDIPERVRASLVKEIQQPINMFTNESTPKVVQRKSFFRRLAENKGSPRIDWEEVIWAVKPKGA